MKTQHHEPDLIFSAPEQSIRRTDQALWNAFRSGCGEAYEQIYRQHFYQLYVYGLKITADKELVQDAIQELFIHIWKQQNNLSETDSIKYYLFKALKRRLTCLLEKAGKVTLLDDFQAVSWLEPEKSEEQKIILRQLAAEKQQQVVAAMYALTNREHQAVTYKFYENLAYPEIASKMAISVPAVYNIIPKPQLYDLKADPGETRNVAASHPQVVQQLASLLQKVREENASR